MKGDDSNVGKTDDDEKLTYVGELKASSNIAAASAERQKVVAEAHAAACAKWEIEKAEFVVAAIIGAAIIAQTQKRNTEQPQIVSGASYVVGKPLSQPPAVGGSGSVVSVVLLEEQQPNELGGTPIPATPAGFPPQPTISGHAGQIQHQQHYG